MGFLCFTSNSKSSKKRARCKCGRSRRKCKHTKAESDLATTLDLTLETASVTLQAIAYVGDVVPGLSKGAGAALAIITLFQDMRQVDASWRGLVKDLCRLMVTVYDHVKYVHELGETIDPRTEDTIRELQRDVMDVKDMIDHEMRRMWIARFLTGTSDKGKVMEYRRSFDTSVTFFQTRLTLEHSQKIDMMFRKMIKEDSDDEDDDESDFEESGSSSSTRPTVAAPKIQAPPSPAIPPSPLSQSAQSVNGRRRRHAGGSRPVSTISATHSNRDVQDDGVAHNYQHDPAGEKSPHEAQTRGNQSLTVPQHPQQQAYSQGGYPIQDATQVQKPPQPPFMHGCGYAPQFYQGSQINNVGDVKNANYGAVMGTLVMNAGQS